MKKGLKGFLLLPTLLAAASVAFTAAICMQTNKDIKLQPILSDASSDSSSGTVVMQSNGPASIKLIDISHHDTVTDWKAIKSAVQGVYIKATEGVTYTDPLFDSYSSAAISNGLSAGFYHFFWPCGNTSNAAAQADHFYATIKKYSYKLVPVLDVEEVNGQTAKSICADVSAFCQEFRKLSGKNLMIYCSPSFANSYLTDQNLSKYPLWIAHYNVNAPKSTLIWRSYNIWQYGETISVPGVREKVDGDLATANVFIDSGDAPTSQGSSPDAL